MRHLIIYIVLSVAITMMQACSSQGTPADGGGDTIRMKYARLLTMVRYADHTDVLIADPWNEGRLLQKLRIDSGTPYRKALVFTSVHCQLMEYLGCEDRIAGVCDLRYMNIPGIQRRAANGYVAEGGDLMPVADCGDAMSPDMEKIVTLAPDVIIVSPFENGNGQQKLQRLGVPVVMAADYMEESPLGRAEWMKFYGLLFGCQAKADSLFEVVDSTYQMLRQMAIKMPKGRSILTERKTGPTWYCPGGRSTIARLIADANGGYAFAGDTHPGSLALSFEQVLAKAGESDVWAFKYQGGQPLTRRQLLDEYHGYAGLKAFRNGNIYQCDTSSKPLFEETAFRPDFLLREFIQILHPGTDLGGLRYYTD